MPVASSVTAEAEWFLLRIEQTYCQWHMRVTGRNTWELLKHFFWPGLKADVAKHCRSCHVCQLAGKPNQVVPPAPLHPMPVVGEPFKCVIVDCVGPLQRTKNGHEYLLTTMCAATVEEEIFRNKD